jgi:L-arabinose isomerase
MKSLVELETSVATRRVSPYRDMISQRVRRQRGYNSETLDASGEIPSRVLAKPVATRCESARNGSVGANLANSCVDVISRGHPFSPTGVGISRTVRFP